VAARAADPGLILLTWRRAPGDRWIAPINVTVPEVEEALGIFGAALRS
jgi:hypothetical protein